MYQEEGSKEYMRSMELSVAWYPPYGSNYYGIYRIIRNRHKNGINCLE